MSTELPILGKGIWPHAKLHSTLVEWTTTGHNLKAEVYGKLKNWGFSFCQTDGLCRMWNLKRHFLEINMKITVLGEYCNCFLVQLDKMVLRFYLCIQLLPQSLVVWIQDLHMPIVSMTEILGKFWHCIFVTNISLGWCYMKQTSWETRMKRNITDR